MQVYSQFGLLLLPIGLLLYYRQFYLYSAEHQLLFLANFMCFALLLDNWLTYAAYLILMGAQAVIVLSIAKEAVLWNRKSHQEKTGWLEWAFNIDTIEIMMLVYACAGWILLRVYTCTNCYYPIKDLSGSVSAGVGSTFVEEFRGWNCTALEFTVMNGVWLVLSVLAHLSCSYLIEHESDTLYKEYLLPYKIVPNIAISCIITIWNGVAWANCNSLQQCGDWYHSQFGVILRCIWFWGFPSSTYIWLIVKKDKFALCENTSSKADKDNGGQIEEALIRKEIDKDYKQRVSKGANFPSYIQEQLKEIKSTPKNKTALTNSKEAQ